VFLSSLLHSKCNALRNAHQKSNELFPFFEKSDGIVGSAAALRSLNWAGGMGDKDGK